ncbi:MAG TPA: thioredoxin domain-containing protein [Candidatus Peribacteraceae bacterium]|nr:thioredoxin domain-containing protein [Candidatus Peribacteraceae bacterium]
MRTPLLAIASAALLLAACTATNGQTDLPQTGTGMQQSSVMQNVLSGTGNVSLSERLLSGGILEIGDAHAPVSLTLFINYSSSYSQQFDQKLLPQLMHDFVSTGQLRVGIVPLELKKYPDSNTSAELLLCAAKQGKGRAMNDLLFGNASASELQKKINDIGLDVHTLQSCMQSDDMKTMLAQEAQTANAYSITLVPSYLLSGHVYTGLPEYSDLKGQVHDALNGR